MAEEQEQDKEFVEYVVKLLVDKPEDVQVSRTIDQLGVLITLDVNAQDMGMVIGRDGMTAKALRTLLRVIGARNNARVNLKINEPEGSTRPPRREYRREEDQTERPKEEEKKTVDDVVNEIQV